MTHTTDKDRAEFEAWALTESKWLHSREPSWMFHINECGDYAHLDVQQAFEAWQAARRAKVAPEGYGSGVMSGNRVTLFFDTQKNAESWFDGFCDGFDHANSIRSMQSVTGAICTSDAMAEAKQLSLAECNTMDCQAGN